MPPGAIFFLNDIDLRVEVADLLYGALPDQVPVVANIIGEPLRSWRTSPIHAKANRFRVDWRAVNPAGHQFQIAFVEQYRHRVEIRRVGLEAQPRRLQRNGATPRKGVENRRQLAVRVLKHLLSGRGIHLGMFVKLLLHQISQDAEEPLPLGVL